MNLQKLKNIFLKSLIACLIAAAALAVITVLIGQFNEVCARALFTIGLVALHCLISFGFIANNEKQETFNSLTFFTNATFIIIILSFITSVFGVWGVLPGSLIGKLYSLYVVLLFAVLHGEVLAKMLGKQQNIDTIIRINFAFMTIVVAMLLPVIFMENNSLPSFYYRLLAACGIIDATLTLSAIILHKMYIQKHPEATDEVFKVQQTIPGKDGVQQIQIVAPRKRHPVMNVFVILLVGYLALQLLIALFVMVLGKSL